MVDDCRPLILHLLYRFDTGGLENGIVNLINHMPESAYRHAVVALTEVTSFRERIVRRDVEFVSLHKPPGQGLWLYPKVHALFRRLRPDIVHTRNLAALEMQVPAWTARVPVRIHGEHGRDVGDLDGSNVRYQRLRRVYRPFVHRYVALSRDLAGYLENKVGVPGERIAQIYNGVDLTRFDAGRVQAPADYPFASPGLWCLGTVGRMQEVKDTVQLARAFVLLLQQQPALAETLRLVMVGDGPLRAQAQAVLDSAGVAHLAWLPGDRSDVPAILGALDCFVLPSLAEGISNGILEAMASGLPVVATAVGGNPELVQEGRTGLLVPPADLQALASALLSLATDPERAAGMGDAGRRRAVDTFSLPAMVDAYRSMYDRLLASSRGQTVSAPNLNPHRKL